MGPRVDKTSLLILNNVKKNSEFVLSKTAESLQIFSQQIQPLLEAQIYSTFCKGLVTLWATDHPKKRFASRKKIFFANLKVFKKKFNLFANLKIKEKKQKVFFTQAVSHSEGQNTQKKGFHKIVVFTSDKLAHSEWLIMWWRNSVSCEFKAYLHFKCIMQN